MGKRFSFSFLGATAFCALWVFLGIILNTNGLENYGSATFVTAPLFAGIISTVLLNYKVMYGLRKSFSTGIVTILISYALLLIFAYEGFLCLIMAAPIAIFVQLIGTTITWLIIRRIRRPKSLAIIAFILFPLHSFIEPELPSDLETHTVSSELIVDAIPTQIWRSITGVNEYARPDNWMMRAGVVYPTRTEMLVNSEGQTVLNCTYSQGSTQLLIDTIRVNELMRFTVAKTPPPMKELSFHSEVHAPHLHGNFTLLYGQIELIPIDKGRTKLIASSAYTHHIKPGGYWKLWSDFFFNQVHQQVLNHIKSTTEQ